MKRTLLPVLASLFVCSAASVASADPLPVAPVKPVSPITTAIPLPRTPILLACPDPSASSIDFALVSRATRFTGRVRVTGTVKNVGGAPYVSGANQQLALLYEIPLGGRPRLVAQRAFQNLAPNEVATVTFDRDWNASSPAEGEFPPNYRLVISYDPDILLDSNPKNDDCGASNNTRERSSSPVNALFR